MELTTALIWGLPELIQPNCVFLESEILVNCRVRILNCAKKHILGLSKTLMPRSLL